MSQNLRGFLNGIRDALELAGVPYMLAGSMAGAAYGRIRATDDINMEWVARLGLDALWRGATEGGAEV